MNNGYQCYYVLLGFDGYKLVEIAKISVESNFADSVRAVYLDGYLYLTTPVGLTVRQVE